MYLATIAFDDISPDDFIQRPIAAFHQMIRPYPFYQLERRVFLERNNERDATERSENYHTVFKRIHRAPLPLVQAAHRSIGIDADDERFAECGGFLEVGDMSAMQDIEATVSEDYRPGKFREPRLKLRRFLDDFTFARGQSMYSNSLTTRVIPPTLRVASVARSPSCFLTSPMR